VSPCKRYPGLRRPMACVTSVLVHLFPASLEKCPVIVLTAIFLVLIYKCTRMSICYESTTQNLEPGSCGEVSYKTAPLALVKEIVNSGTCCTFRKLRR